MRILDLGCGEGEKLLELNKAIPNAEFTGLDISVLNIQQAKENATKEHRVKVSFHTVDYLDYETEPFDIIYADSVLHLIAAPDALLYSKLSKDLQPKGIFIVTMPYDCLYNRVLIMLRLVCRSLRSKVLDKVILKIASLIYPAINPKILYDRIPYMYLIPHRMDSSSFRKLLKNKYQLTVLDSIICHSPSRIKPKHKMIIFQKR